MFRKISATRLITSYALPPQTSFSCAPKSLRTRISKSRSERRTYVSTVNPHPEITLFRETLRGKSAVQNSTTTRSVSSSQAAVVFLGMVTALRPSETSISTPDLLLVKEDGEIQCLDGDSLDERWTSPSSALRRDAYISKDAKVEFAHLTDAHTAGQGVLKGRKDVFTHFTQEISENGFNPDILIIITKSISASTRTVHIASLPKRTLSQTISMTHFVDSLLTTRLPTPKGRSFLERASFNLQVSAGTIQQLSGSVLTTFDLATTIPMEISSLTTNDAQSFLRLSNTSVMISTRSTISVYNPKYQSILGSIHLDGASTGEGTSRKKRKIEQTNGHVDHRCTLVSYYPKLNTAVAIADNELVAIQIEGTSRATGLLIDSLGSSIDDRIRPEQVDTGFEELRLTTLDSYLPGSVAASEELSKGEIEALEAAVLSGDASQFDKLMADKLGWNWAENVHLANGTDFPKLKKFFLDSKGSIPAAVDRRWIIFALSKIFDWTSEEGSEQGLTVPFYPPSVFMWLLRKGHMTSSNIETALRPQLQRSGLDRLPAGELVNALVEIDRDMQLLFLLISRNLLSAADLLTSIRLLMESLEIFGVNSPTQQQMLTNGSESENEDEDIEARVEELEAEAEADLALAEYQLGPGSGVRGEALSIALSKLYTCPTDTIVFALQTTLSTQEVVSLIYLLRFELAKGAWTSRYLDVDQLESMGEEVSDNSIVLISSLLNNCIDSVGAGGWISGDARLVNGDPFEAEELIASLKLEVSAALEGIEEATYLKGLMSEMIRYGDSLQRGSNGPLAGQERKTKNTPILIPLTEGDASILPFGLKADQKISRLRVGAGGEVQVRSIRDIGRHKSHRVGEYTREKIMI